MRAACGASLLFYAGPGNPDPAADQRTSVILILANGRVGVVTGGVVGVSPPRTVRASRTVRDFVDIFLTRPRDFAFCAFFVAMTASSLVECTLMEYTERATNPSAIKCLILCGFPRMDGPTRRMRMSQNGTRWSQDDRRAVDCAWQRYDGFCSPGFSGSIPPSLNSG